MANEPCMATCSGELLKAVNYQHSKIKNVCFCRFLNELSSYLDQIIQSQLHHITVRLTKYIFKSMTENQLVMPTWKTGASLSTPSKVNLNKTVEELTRPPAPPPFKLRLKDGAFFFINEILMLK